MKPISRRAVLAGGIAATALMRPAFAQNSLAGVTLRVATFGGGSRDFFHSIGGVPLEKLGAKVEYVAGAPAEHFAKLIAARGRAAPFDVVEMVDALVPDFVGAGFLQKLELDAIANRRELPAFMADDLKVAHWLTQEGIVYNFEKFKELGLDAPKRYADLANPKLAGKVIFPDVGTGGWVNSMVGVSVQAGGSEANIEPGLTFIRDTLKPRSFFSGSGETEYTEFKNGDIWAAVMHAGWAIQMRKRGIDHVRSAFADMGGGKRGMLKLGFLGIVKGTSPAVQKAGQMFIDNVIATDSQEAMAKARGLVPSNTAALGRLTGDPLLAENLMTNPADIANVYKIDFDKVNVPEWTDKWNRMIARR